MQKKETNKKTKKTEEKERELKGRGSKELEKQYRRQKAAQKEG